MLKQARLIRRGPAGCVARSTNKDPLGGSTDKERRGALNLGRGIYCLLDVRKARTRQGARLIRRGEGEGEVFKIRARNQLDPLPALCPSIPYLSLLVPYLTQSLLKGHLRAFYDYFKRPKLARLRGRNRSLKIA
jgi:hypothetical protein